MDYTELEIELTMKAHNCTREEAISTYCAIVKQAMSEYNEKLSKEFYKQDRKNDYPSLSDQLDMLWHMMDDETLPGKGSDWYNTILDIKTKYPKPQGN